MAVTCIIIDDEPLALDLLENYIGRTNELTLKMKFDSAVVAFEYLANHDVDLVFLDIAMPDLNGMEFARILGPRAKVIFTTAFREYAADSYELNAVDYLLKPISFERFLKSIQKVITIEEEEKGTLHTESVINVKADNKTYRILPGDIIYIESLKDFIKIHIKDNCLISYQNISHFESLLPQGRFLRIHRSFIVAKVHIESFSATAVQINGEELPIGRTYKQSVNNVLNKV